MTDIQNKLLELKRRFCLSTSDLAVLLDSNRSTVSSWESGVVPSETRVPLIEEKLDAILAAEERFPVPLSVTQYQRKQYLLDAINGRPASIPQPHTTTGGTGL